MVREGSWRCSASSGGREQGQEEKVREILCFKP
jgi:hypothetical protein